MCVLHPHLGETILHCLLLKDTEHCETGQFKECLDFLLKDQEKQAQLARIINRKDILGNTALHYATQVSLIALIENFTTSSN